MHLSGRFGENKWQTAKSKPLGFFYTHGPNKIITAGKAKSGFKKRLISAKYALKVLLVIVL